MADDATFIFTYLDSFMSLSKIIDHPVIKMKAP